MPATWYNDVNGTSTWSVPNSWEDVTTAQLYQLTENGRSYVGEVAVQNGQVTLQLDLSIPYILVKEKAAQAHRYNADGSVMKKRRSNCNASYIGRTSLGIWKCN
ncbi:MAG: glycoside hydrolase family 101 beta sandwich domain-containing protein [Coprococcus phoceensis]